MNRRAALRLAGATMAGLAGCIGLQDGSTVTPPDETVVGPRQGDDLPADDTPGDGYPPSFETTPAERQIDASSFDTKTVDGHDVPLAPFQAVYYWYARGEARFADARGSTSYGNSHIYGAVLSPAPDGRENDPVIDWPKGDRIVCYCGCPHHLSSMRAASLMDDGYEEVYVIDEGFWDGWYNRGYPIAGSEVQSRPAVWVIDGVADLTYAGATAWARHGPTGQREATDIGPDGRFQLELRFADVTGDSVVEIETPGYRVEAPLDELTGTVVTDSS